MLGFDMVRQNMTLPLQTSPNGAIAK
ncbi:MAG: hypothetical protein ACI8VE_001424, partial [Natrialbaceae archaeon]